MVDTTINTLLHIVPCKTTWKSEVKLAVDKLWNQKLISDCSQKSSLAFCETAILSIGNIHAIWTAVQNNIKDVRRGGNKARLLTGTYTRISFDRILQTDSSMSLIISFSSFMDSLR
jgi:hypothetical protein